MKQIKITLPYGLYECARREAIRTGNGNNVSHWIACEMRSGLRSKLNKSGYKAAELDMLKEDETQEKDA